MAKRISDEKASEEIKKTKSDAENNLDKLQKQKNYSYYLIKHLVSIMKKS